MGNCIKYFFTTSLLLCVVVLHAQNQRPSNEDSLKAVLKTQRYDTTRVGVLLRLSGSYLFKEPDSCLFYASAALETSRKLNYELGIVRSATQVGEANRLMGNYKEALRLQVEALKLSQKLDTLHFEADCTGFIGMNCYEVLDYDRAFLYLKKALAMHKELSYEHLTLLLTVYLARAFTETGQPDSAFYFLAEAKKMAGSSEQLLILRLHSLGDAYKAINKMDSASYYYRQAMKMARKNPAVVPRQLSITAARLSEDFELKGQVDSSLYYARFSFRVAKMKKLNASLFSASRLLSNLHRKIGNSDSAFFYQDIANSVNSFGNDTFRELQSMLLQEQRRNQEILQAEERRRNTIQLIGLVSITTVILIASILLFRSNRIKQKTNQVLQKTLTELRSTQSLLIQSEKMASLGELTAGIAHEIQNPLNFVNNFSEVNAELIDDLKKEMASGNRQSADEIADSIKENQEKINHHGKRADGIVKSMLQHSRLSSDQKELTDINALCDEYVRLTYHGYRANDKSFNAAFKVNLDASIPKVNVIPQDIGRVILNLVNNAFHAVDERSAFTNATADEGYEPMVTISTKRVNARIEIRVQDNGSGIADSIKERIFQPFFTTKPTGQGTGLGLSLSYDIIKAHGGTLEVNSPPAGRVGKEGAGSEFIIQLPT